MEHLQRLQGVFTRSLRSCGASTVSRVMYNLGTFLEGPRDQGPGLSRTKGYNLGTR